MARIKGENLAAPQPRGGAGTEDGPGLQELLILFFVGVPIIGSVLSGIFGRKLGSLLTGGAAGRMGCWFTHSLLLAGAAGLVSLFVVGIMGVGWALRGATRGRSGPVVWGGGLGGDFSGGGAGGSW